jgi:hypothetical protein
LRKAALFAQLGVRYITEESFVIPCGRLINNILLDKFGKCGVFFSHYVVEGLIISLDERLELYGEICIEVRAVKEHIE